jgi:hypothetical protein
MYGNGLRCFHMVNIKIKSRYIYYVFFIFIMQYYELRSNEVALLYLRLIYSKKNIKKHYNALY